MRFTWTGTGAREFTTPDTSEGLLGGFMLGELKWLKQQLKVPRIEDLDVVEARIAAFFLTIRRADHELLPIAQWPRLTMGDFKLVPHAVTGYDQDGDCGECHLPVDAQLHQVPDAPALDPTSPPPAPGEVPPVAAPAVESAMPSNGTSGTGSP